jgi:DNA-binding response OmpR family regulator
VNDRADLKSEKACILVAEDSAVQAEFLRSLLQEFDYDVVIAPDGAQALDLLVLRRPAIIISDVVMPVMDGYELCRRVKAVEKFRDIPFMLFTRLTEPQDIFQGLESGADFYNVKPYDAAVLVERVRTILHRPCVPSVPAPLAALDVTYAGRRYSLHAGRTQILDLLLATFENIVHKNNELVRLNQKLTEALETNKILCGLIPICSYCKKIRDDRGYWEQVESFVSRLSAARFSHSVCPQCSEKFLADLRGLPAGAAREK